MDPAPSSPRLLTQVRQAIRLHQYSRRTEEASVAWVRRYVRHPGELGAEDVRRFLTALADQGRASASTQTQALSGLLFLYRQVLGRELDSVAIVRPAKPVRLPVVLGRGTPCALSSCVSWNGFAGSIIATWPAVVAMSSSLERITENRRVLRVNGLGSMCSRPPGCTWIGRADSGIGTICTNRLCSVRSSERCRQPASPNARPVIACAIRSRLICWRMGTT